MPYTVQQVPRSKRDQRLPPLCFVLARGTSTGPFGFPKGYPSSWLEAGKAGVVDNYSLVVSQHYPWALGFFPAEKRPQHNQISQDINFRNLQYFNQNLLRPWLFSRLHIASSISNPQFSSLMFKDGVTLLPEPFPHAGSTARAMRWPPSTDGAWPEELTLDG